MLKDALRQVEEAMVAVDEAKNKLTQAEAAASDAQAIANAARRDYLQAADAARGSHDALQKEIGALMPPVRHEIK